MLVIFSSINSLIFLEIFGIAKSTVIRTVQVYQNKSNFQSKRRTGRPRGISERDIRYLVKKTRKSPKKTSQELARDLGIIKSGALSCSYIRKLLLKRGLKSYSCRKKPFITKSMAKGRLAWCKEHQNKSLEYWRNVLFTDETSVQLNPFSTMNSVRRFCFENLHQKLFISPKIKFGIKVMFWGGIS